MGFVNEMTFAQGAFSFGRLFSQNVTGTGFIIHNFPGARFAEAFGSRTICFYFGHLKFSFALRTLALYDFIVVVKKNVQVFKRFFLQPLMPQFRHSEHYYGKRYNG